LADSLIKDLMTCGYGHHINHLFKHLYSNQDFNKALCEGLPASTGRQLTSYFKQTGEMPSWLDPVLFQAGQKVFAKHGPEIAFLLSVKSLPMCFACWRGAQVLYRTGRMHSQQDAPDGLSKRLIDTSQMVMNVLAPDSLEPAGSGIITLQKVRLIHAFVRYHLTLPESPAWDETIYGEPVNQEDMAGTLMSFSALVLDGLREIGVLLTGEEQEGYMHCWRVAGHVMGIDEALLPVSYIEGHELGLLIMQRQAGESEEARIMTRNCVEFLKSLFPGKLFEKLPEYLIWYFMQETSRDTGIDLAAILGVRDGGSNMEKLAVKMACFASRQMSILDTHSELAGKLISTVKQEFLKGLIKYWGGRYQPQLQIPDQLKTQWQLA
jgi:hypothetical protein